MEYSLIFQSNYDIFLLNYAKRQFSVATGRWSAFFMLINCILGDDSGDDDDDYHDDDFKRRFFFSVDDGHDENHSDDTVDDRQFWQEMFHSPSYFKDFHKDILVTKIFSSDWCTFYLSYELRKLGVT